MRPKLMPDHQDRDGVWVASRYIPIYGVKQLYTLSGRKYSSMVERCTPGSREQRKHPSYVGCVNGFESFQEFAGWHRAQVGYGEFDLDKDLLIPGNKTYSPETCILLPRRLNQLLAVKPPRDLPVGVYKLPNGKFQASCGDLSGKPKYLGVFDSIPEAEAAYLRVRNSHVAHFASLWRDRLDARAYTALIERYTNVHHK